MSDKPEESPKKDKPKDDDGQKLPPVTPSISGSETSPEMSRNVDDLRNKDDLIGWLDPDDEIKSQPRRRTVKPNVYNRRRLTRPGSDIKKELEELANEIHGRWQLEPSPLKVASEQKEKLNRTEKRIVPFEPNRSISRSLDYSTSSSPSSSPSPSPTPSPSSSLLPSPKFTRRYEPLSNFRVLPDIEIRMNGDTSLTVRNAFKLFIILFCFNLIILAVVVYKLAFS